MPKALSTAKLVLGAFGLEWRRYRQGPDGPSYSNFGEQDLLLQFADEMAGLPRVCVDIGAGDGAGQSNSLGLFERGFAGAALEWDGERAAQLALRHRGRPGVLWARTRVTPENVVSLLRGLEIPKDFGVLSLDIDGYDHFVLKALLESFRPWILLVEINEKIPPPLRFTVLWDPEYVWHSDHFYGQSLSQAHALAAAFGYALVALEYNNAFFVLRGESPRPELTPERAYREGYLDRPDRLTKLPWNRDMEDLLGTSPEMAARLLRERFVSYAGKYLLEW